MSINFVPEKRSHPVVELLEKVRSDYVANRFTFVEGRVMETILRFLGATDEDLRKLSASGAELGQDPTLPFRESRNGRFLFDFEKQHVSRLEFQPFVLSADEDFVRDDSGMLRNFRGIQDNVQQNTAFQALLKFKAWVIQGMEIKHRNNLVEDPQRWVSTIFQLRTITSPELTGEPAMEGVHSDGVEHTMTTFFGSKNMTLGSAVSQIHTPEQQTGIHWNEVNPAYVIGECQHRHFLDTLLIVDTELKHSVSHVKAWDPQRIATRDMMILFTRRPKCDSHSTFEFDSLNMHPEIPLTIPLK